MNVFVTYQVRWIERPIPKTILVTCWKGRVVLGKRQLSQCVSCDELKRSRRYYSTDLHCLALFAPFALPSQSRRRHQRRCLAAVDHHCCRRTLGSQIQRRFPCALNWYQPEEWLRNIPFPVLINDRSGKCIYGESWTNKSCVIVRNDFRSSLDKVP